MVYYKTISYNQSRDRIEEYCQNLQNIQCQHMQHCAVGFEEITLQRLQDYFSNLTDIEEGEDTRVVVYLHNKRSSPNKFRSG